MHCPLFSCFKIRIVYGSKMGQAVCGGLGVLVQDIFETYNALEVSCMDMRATKIKDTPDNAWIKLQIFK